jgi:hypothetical protein
VEKIDDYSRYSGKYFSGDARKIQFSGKISNIPSQTYIKHLKD